MTESTTSQSVEPPTSTREGLWTRVRSLLRSRITAGLALVLPIWITVLVIGFVFRIMRNASLWLLEAIVLSPVGEPLLQSWQVSAERLREAGLKALPAEVQFGIGIAAVVLTIVLLYFLGAITTNVVGRRVVLVGEAMVDRVPLVKVVYQASKKVMETFSDTSRPFKRVVMVRFPTKDSYCVGFVTRTITDSRSGDELYSVFVATSPNPTSGFVLVCRRDDVIELDWGIEEAIKVIMSGGMLMPDTIPFGTARLNASEENT